MNNWMEVCNVCGFEEASQSHQIREPGLAQSCPCCGRSGVVSGAIEARMRESWFLSGMPWSASGRQAPQDWDPILQLKRLFDRV